MKILFFWILLSIPLGMIVGRILSEVSKEMEDGD
jgi:hypothetical protein